VSRTVTNSEPVTTTLFSPLQLRPRALLSQLSAGFARWMTAYVVPFRSLVTEHRTAVVVQSLALDYATPNLTFDDAVWLTAETRMATGESGEWLHLWTDVRSGDRTVAEGRLRIRVLELAGEESLAARPGTLPETLRDCFTADERLPDDARKVLRIDKPPMPDEEAIGARHWRLPLLRSQCELADQWSFVEMVELATCARDRLYTTDDCPAPAVRDALGAPLHSVRAVFRKPMFLFDECAVTTSARASATGPELVFTHDFAPVDARRSHLTVWETLTTRPGAPRHDR
jgi:hypothetical protein